MNLTDSIILEFKSGYFEVQHKKVADESGNEYLSDKKTFANQSHLEKYLAPYSVSESVLSDGVNAAKKEAGIKAAKAAKESSIKFNKIRAGQ